MDLADNAQMVGESRVGIGRVEIADLGIDVEPQEQRHVGVIGRLPNHDPILVALVRLALGCLRWEGRGSGAGRAGRRVRRALWGRALVAFLQLLLQRADALFEGRLRVPAGRRDSRRRSGGFWSGGGGGGGAGGAGGGRGGGPPPPPPPP